MIKAELKMILKLIDNHTSTKEIGYYQTEVRHIDERNIKGLKQDIEDLFGEGTDDQARA